MIRRLALIVTALAVAMMFAVFEPPHPARADTGTNWTGAYFNNRDLQGTPVFTRIDPAIAFNWGPVRPGPGIGSSNFAGRLITGPLLHASLYKFNIHPVRAELAQYGRS